MSHHLHPHLHYSLTTEHITTPPDDIMGNDTGDIVSSDLRVTHHKDEEGNLTNQLFLYLSLCDIVGVRFVRWRSMRRSTH